MTGGRLVRCLVLIAAGAVSGCAASAGSATWLGRDEMTPVVILASDFGDDVAQAGETQSDKTQPPTNTDNPSDSSDEVETTGQKTDTGDNSKSESEKESTQKTTPRPSDVLGKKPKYTAPSDQLKTAGLTGVAVMGMLVATVDQESESDQGRSAAESSVMGSVSAGLPGLAPPVLPGASVSVGLVGLQSGAPLAGFSAFNTMVPRQNPVMSNCQALARAGFFGGSVATCRSQFRR